MTGASCGENVEYKLWNTRGCDIKKTKTQHFILNNVKLKKSKKCYTVYDISI